MGDMHLPDSVVQDYEAARKAVQSYQPKAVSLNPLRVNMLDANMLDTVITKKLLYYLEFSVVEECSNIFLSETPFTFLLQNTNENRQVSKTGLQLIILCQSKSRKVPKKLLKRASRANMWVMNSLRTARALK